MQEICWKPLPEKSIACGHLTQWAFTCEPGLAQCCNINVVKRQFWSYESSSSAMTARVVCYIRVRTFQVAAMMCRDFVNCLCCWLQEGMFWRLQSTVRVNQGTDNFWATFSRFLLLLRWAVWILNKAAWSPRKLSRELTVPVPYSNDHLTSAAYVGVTDERLPFSSKTCPRHLLDPRRRSFAMKGEKLRWAELAQLMIKVEERFAAFDPPPCPPACMVSGMGGPKTTELQRGCRNLPVTAMFGSLHSVVPTRRHLAFTAGGIFDPHTPDSPRGKRMFEVDCPSHKHAPDQGGGLF